MRVSTWCTPSGHQVAGIKWRAGRTGAGRHQHQTGIRPASDRNQTGINPATGHLDQAPGRCADECTSLRLGQARQVHAKRSDPIRSDPIQSGSGHLARPQRLRAGPGLGSWVDLCLRPDPGPDLEPGLEPDLRPGHAPGPGGCQGRRRPWASSVMTWTPSPSITCSSNRLSAATSAGTRTRNTWPERLTASARRLGDKATMSLD